MDGLWKVSEELEGTTRIKGLSLAYVSTHLVDVTPPVKTTVTTNRHTYKLIHTHT